MSHELLHHAEPKLFFCLMHMVEIFEFEFVFEFELSSLEKIKRKGIRNSREKEKPNSAQSAQLGPCPVCAPVCPPLPDKRTPCLSAQSRARRDGPRDATIAAPQLESFCIVQHLARENREIHLERLVGSGGIVSAIAAPNAVEAGDCSLVGIFHDDGVGARSGSFQARI